MQTEVVIFRIVTMEDMTMPVYKKPKKKKSKRFFRALFHFILIIFVLSLCFWGISVILTHCSPTKINQPIGGDIIDKFTHTYGILSEDTLKAVDKSEIPGIEKIEQNTLDYASAYGNIDYRTATGTEGFDFFTTEYQQYLLEMNNHTNSQSIYDYQQMIRKLSEVTITKVINFPDDDFCYVEIECKLTLVEANENYNKDRWPDGIGSTITNIIRLEYVPLDDDYKISAVDIAISKGDQREEKYEKIFSKIYHID